MLGSFFKNNEFYAWNVGGTARRACDPIANRNWRAEVDMKAAIFSIFRGFLGVQLNEGNSETRSIPFGSNIAVPRNGCKSEGCKWEGDGIFGLEDEWDVTCAQPQTPRGRK